MGGLADRTSGGLRRSSHLSLGSSFDVAHVLRMEVSRGLGIYSRLSCVTFVMLVLAAACSSSDAGESTTTTTTTQATPSTAATTTTEPSLASAMEGLANAKGSVSTSVNGATSQATRSITYTVESGKRLDVYSPSEPGAWPVVIVVHGWGQSKGGLAACGWTCGVFQRPCEACHARVDRFRTSRMRL